MTIFVIIAQPNPHSPKLPGAIQTSFPDGFIQLSDDAWLVASSGSASALSDKLGISNGENGAAVVMEMAGYYGRASTNIWSWIKEKWEATSSSG